MKKKKDKPLFLVSNDDGIHAPGVHELARVASGLGEVVMVAPHTERSGFSHCLTITRPLRVVQLEERSYCSRIFEVTGTPADCVKIALNRLLGRRPDWVLSGINRGGNLGTDTLYSGTVGGAMEGVINGIRSIAVSSHGSYHKPFRYDTAAKVVKLILEKQDQLSFTSNVVLNVNVPSVPFYSLKGICSAQMGRRIYDNNYVMNEDPRGKPYYWLGPDQHQFEPAHHSDFALVANGYASISALRPSFLHEEINEQMGQAMSELFKGQFTHQQPPSKSEC